MSAQRSRRRTTVAPRESSNSGPKTLLAVGMALVLAAVTFAAYSSVRTHEFQQFDDAAYVTQNGAIRAGLSLANLKWAFTTPYAGNWHPLTAVSHMADVELFGLDPGWHHLTSVLIHILTSLLLLRLIWRATGEPWPSAFVAAMFALHPLHVESVAWVAERKDVLSALFWVTTCSAYVTYVRRPTPIRYGVVALSLVLALLSKPMAVTLPFALLLMDAWPLGRWQGTSDSPDAKTLWPLVREKLALVALAAASAAVTFFVQQQMGAVQSLDAFSVATRVANVPVAYAQYMLLTIFPGRLAPLYPYPPVSWLASAAALLVLGAITTIVFRARKTLPFLLMGWCWFFGTLVPVIGLIQVGAQPYADRYTYLPAIGLFIMLAWTAHGLAVRRPSLARALVVAGVVVAAAAAVATARQVAHWKDGVALWEHTVAVTRDNFRAYTNLGFALAEVGQRSRAVDAYTESIRINPRYANTRNYFGYLLADMGEHDRAEAEFRAALELQPRMAQAHNNLGLLRVAQGRFAEAAAEFKTTLELDPSFVPARNNLAIAYVQQERYDLAIPEFEEAVRRQPESAQAHYNLATALANSGRKRDALPHFQAAAKTGTDIVKVHHEWGAVLMDLGDLPGATTQFMTALSANPQYAPALRDLGRSLALSGRLKEGLNALQRAVQIDPNDADYRYDFGAALAQAGMIPQAIAEMQMALRINPAHAEAIEALKLLTKKK